MPDSNYLQVSIFQPQVSADQHRLAVRYDALRGALGKLGRPYLGSSALILPAPLLLLDRDHVPESRRGDYPSRRAWLVFANAIPGAESVTLWDARGNRVGEVCGFAPMTRIPVDDPGEGGSVEVRDGRDVTFKVGIPVRVFGIPVRTEPHLAAFEEVLVEAYEEGRAEGLAEGREESGAETPKE
jgi:hypothetical protein